jgi:hypothetical protein
MTTANEIMDRIRELLDRLPGVSITDFHTWPSRTDLALYVGVHDAVVSLARCCAGANLPLAVEPAGSWRDMVAPPGQDDVRYILRLRHDLQCLIPLGVFLARALRYRGLMDRSEADALGAAWNADIG